jgi:hypothetical protein
MGLPATKLVESDFARQNLKCDQVIIRVRERTCAIHSTQNGVTIVVDEAWTQVSDNTVQSTGLWLKRDAQGLIARTSSLAKMMEHYHVAQLNDLLGREVLTCPKRNGYLVIVAADGMEDGHLPDAQMPT